MSFVVTTRHPSIYHLVTTGTSIRSVDLRDLGSKGKTVYLNQIH